MIGIKFIFYPNCVELNGGNIHIFLECTMHIRYHSKYKSSHEPVDILLSTLNIPCMPGITITSYRSPCKLNVPLNTQKRWYQQTHRQMHSNKTRTSIICISFYHSFFPYPYVIFFKQYVYIDKYMIHADYHGIKCIICSRDPYVSASVNIKRYTQ